MKKRICLLFAVLFLLSLCGCNDPVIQNPTIESKEQHTSGSEPTTPGSSTQWKWQPAPGGINTGCFSDTGYYHAENGFLYYTECTTGISVCLCSKAACTHTDNMTCDAVVNILPYNSMFYWNEGLYYIEQDGFGYHICRRNADGNAKSEVAVLCEEELKASNNVTVTVDQFVVVGNWLYFCAGVSGVTNDGSGTNFYDIKQLLCRLDLRTGREEVLLTDEENSMVLIAAQENALLYTREEKAETAPGEEGYDEELKQCRIAVMRWDEASGESKVLLEKTRENMYAPRMIGDLVLYYTSQDATECRTVDPETGEEQEAARVVGTVLNDKYLFTRIPGDDKKTVIERETGNALPIELESKSMFVETVSEKWFILALYDTNEKYIISMDAISDGIQLKDAVLIS
jgi:hypothetical protein